MHVLTRRTASRWTQRLVETWPAWRRYLYTGVAAVVVTLVALQVRSLDWPAAWDALRAYDAATLALAGALAAVAYALYTGFDQLGRAYIGHGIPRWRVSAIAFVSYAFNQSLGVLIGSVGMRLRLYPRYGLKPQEAVRVVGFAIATNWLGYALLAGGVFASGVVELSDRSPLSTAALRLIGVALLAVVASYLLACVFARRRSLRILGRDVPLPPTRFALVQLALAALEWSAIGAIPFVLLGGQPSYPTVLAALLLAAVAGVVTRVPAGLGVIEVVFLRMLEGVHAQETVLAALLAYRIVYYLVPLAVAGATYLALEAGRARRPSPASQR